MSKTTLDDFLTAYLLKEGIANKDFIQNTLDFFTAEIKGANISGAFIATPLDKKSEKINFTIYPDKIPEIKVKLTDITKEQYAAQIDKLLKDGIGENAKRATGIFNNLTKSFKQNLLLLVDNTNIELTSYSAINADVEGDTLFIEFQKEEAAGAEDIGKVSTIFRDVLRYNILYVMIINALDELKQILDRIPTPNAEEIRTAIENDFNIERVMQLSNEAENQLQLSFKKIAEAFLIKYGQPLNEDFLRFYDAYEDKIPDIFYSEDVSDKVFIESLTRVYKTLLEALDVALSGKADKVNQFVRQKAKNIKLDDEIKKNIVDGFLKNDIEAQKEKLREVIEEIRMEILEMIDISAAPPGAAEEGEPSAEANQKSPEFNPEAVKKLVDDRLTDYQNAYDRFFAKVRQAR